MNDIVIESGFFGIGGGDRRWDRVDGDGSGGSVAYVSVVVEGKNGIIIGAVIQSRVGECLNVCIS